MGLFRNKTKREKVDWAFGLWLSTPRTTNKYTFISNLTGIPREEARELLHGKKE